MHTKGQSVSMQSLFFSGYFPFLTAFFVFFGFCWSLRIEPNGHKIYTVRQSSILTPLSHIVDLDIQIRMAMVKRSTTISAVVGIVVFVLFIWSVRTTWHRLNRRLSRSLLTTFHRDVSVKIEYNTEMFSMLSIPYCAKRSYSTGYIMLYDCQVQRGKRV